VAFPRLRHPIVQAPLAGGPSTPELAAAVTNAGALGFVAGGYLSPHALRAQIRRTRELTNGLFGVNLFVLEETDVDAEAVAAYARRVGGDAADAGFDDDAFAAKLDVVAEEHVELVSFTFGCPSREAIARVPHAWVTVTEPAEARAAAQAGATALVVQGAEAGGHRGTWDDRDGNGELGLLALLRLVARETNLPLVASGGIADGAGIAAVLAAGARAAQIGTAFLRTPEAATSAPHRAALAESRPTALTRAFTGRRARGLVNRFMVEHEAEAPSAYPHVNHVTAPLRAAARAAGDAESINLWAGEAYALAEDAPAADLVERWSAEARAALDGARQSLYGS
jgi:nitronate monooxygenase